MPGKDELGDAARPAESRRELMPYVTPRGVQVALGEQDEALGGHVIEKSDIAIVLEDNARSPILLLPKFGNEEVPEYVLALVAVFVRMQKDYEWYSELLEWYEEQKVS